MMKIEEHFKLFNLDFYGPLSASIGISGPSINSLEKCLVSVLRIIILVLNAVRITCKRQILSSCLHLERYDHSPIFELDKWTT